MNIGGVNVGGYNGAAPAAHYGPFSVGSSGAFTDFRVVNTASAVDYIQVSGSAAGAPGTVTISAQGSDSLIQLDLVSKGTAGIRLVTGGGTQAIVSNIASAVNHLRLHGAAAGGTPDIATDGSDAAVGLNLVTKGSGGLGFFTNTSVRQFNITHTASAVNYWQATGAATAGTPTLYATGSDAAVSGRILAKGAGGFSFYSHGDSTPRRQLQVDATASAVNYVTITGQATSAGPSISSSGSDTNVDLFLVTKGTGTHWLTTGASSNIQFAVAHTASAVNLWAFSGGATGNNIVMTALGADTNVGVTFFTKGAGALDFGGNSAVQLKVAATASAVNYVQVAGGATGSPGTVTVSAQGSDSNIVLALTPKGTGYLALSSGVSVASNSLGTISSGTVTPDPQTRGFQHYTNNGAHTLAPSSNTGSVLVDITNGASAGAITTTGFGFVDGDAFTTTNGHKFRCSIVIGNGGSSLTVKALQ